MRKIILSLMVVSVLIASIGTFVMAKRTDVTVNFNQAQFQWRGTSPYGSGAAFGHWTYVYQNYATSGEYTLTGNVLHTSWDYSPHVEDQRGESTVYVYDKDSELWVEKEGAVKYVYEPGYCSYTVVNKFRGFLDFNGMEPSTANFNHGEAYQWVYIFAPQTDTGVTDCVPYAHWDDRTNAWLVGFSIYYWDSGAQSYTTVFPDPFPEPVPANN